MKYGSPTSGENIQEWELNEITDLFKGLEGVPMSLQFPDNLICGRSDKGIYTMKEGYCRMPHIKWNDRSMALETKLED